MIKNPANLPQHTVFKKDKYFLSGKKIFQMKLLNQLKLNMGSLKAWRNQMLSSDPQNPVYSGWMITLFPSAGSLDSSSFGSRTPVKLRPVVKSHSSGRMSRTRAFMKKCLHQHVSVSNFNIRLLVTKKKSALLRKLFCRPT